VRVEEKRQKPPKLHDLPSLQKLCGSRFGWSAAKTLELAQELYDGQGKKIITYPRAEVRYLPENAIADAPKIVAGLREGQTFRAIAMPEPLHIRKGAAGSFHDKGLEGASHHAVIPTPTRSAPCARSGRACRWTRKSTSTSSRAPISPRSCPTSAAKSGSGPIMIVQFSTRLVVDV
jgi:DNA topoisomerase IA